MAVARGLWSEEASDPFRSEAAIIRRISDEVRALSDTFVVLLALNRKPQGAGSGKHDYERFTVTTEYFSDSELAELTRGFEAIGCRVDVSNGEKEFNERLVRGDFSRYDRLRKVVYHSTGSGTGRCRTAFMPALCELYGMSDCGNDVYSSTIPENKVHFFDLLAHYGFPIPKTWCYDTRRGWLRGEPSRTGKLIVKPAYECASIGVTEQSVSVLTDGFLRHVAQLSEALSQPVLVQEFVEGYEVEVPVFDLGRPFAPTSVGIDLGGSMLAGDRFLTYDKVYADEYGFYSFSRHFPARGAALRRIATDSFETLDLRGTVRVDFRVGEKGDAFIIDYNNAPHLTAFHSCARAVKDLGFDYADMLSLVLHKHVRPVTPPLAPQ